VGFGYIVTFRDVKPEIVAIRAVFTDIQHTLKLLIRLGDDTDIISIQEA
jgi:hypothetical protein